MFYEDCRDDVAEVERAPEQTVELRGAALELLSRMARQLGMREADVVRLALHALAKARTGSEGRIEQ